jgi:hypothetical protein
MLTSDDPRNLHKVLVHAVVCDSIIESSLQCARFDQSITLKATFSFSIRYTAKAKALRSMKHSMDWKLQTIQINQSPSISTVFQQAHLLSLQLELREEIFSYVFPNQEVVCRRLSSWSTGSHKSCCHPQTCSLNIIHCNRQLYQEVRSFLHRRTISIATVPDSSELITNTPCLNARFFSNSRRISFSINPFQYTPALPGVYLSLAMLCQEIRNLSHISHIKIEFDGTLPRTQAPLYINEDDLDRDPSIIIILLQPFGLLRNVGKVEIDIFGGPLNDSWSQTPNFKALQQD